MFIQYSSVRSIILFIFHKSKIKNPICLNFSEFKAKLSWGNHFKTYKELFVGSVGLGCFYFAIIFKTNFNWIKCKHELTKVIQLILFDSLVKFNSCFDSKYKDSFGKSMTFIFTSMNMLIINRAWNYHQYN